MPEPIENQTTRASDKWVPKRRKSQVEEEQNEDEEEEEETQEDEETQNEEMELNGIC